MSRKKKKRRSGPRPSPEAAAAVEDKPREAAPPAVPADSAEPPAADTKPAVARRDFLATAGRLAAGAGAGLALAGGLLAALPAGSARQDFLPLGSLARFPFGTLVFIPGPEVFVLRGERGLAAFSARCTHLGCTVRRAAGGFECPCHGARYDEQGRLLAGPARRDLDWYRLQVDNNSLIWLDRSRTLPAGSWTKLGAEGTES